MLVEPTAVPVELYAVNVTDAGLEEGLAHATPVFSSAYVTNAVAGAGMARTEASATGVVPLYSRNKALADTGPVQFALAQPVVTAAVGAASVCRWARPCGGIVSVVVVTA